MSDPVRAAERAPSLALVMIVRDERRCIERCLRSVAPYVDRMLVLDTGSRDDTVDRARACGADVHAFRWIDDFSAARNAALDLAHGFDFRLVLDGDEWLAEGGPLLRSAASRLGKGIGAVRVDSGFEQDGRTQLAPSWLPRLLPSGVRYEGRVHEQPDASVPRTRLPVVIGHDGYLAAQMAAKQGRNRRLLERALSERPGDAYLHYQRGKDLEIAGEYGPASDAYEQAHALSQAGDAFRHDLIVRMLSTFKRAGRHRQAFDLAQIEADQWDDSPDFHFAIGDLALDCAVGDPQAAASTWFPLIEAHWLRCLQIGERPELEGAVAGRGSYLAAHNLRVFYRAIGDAARAEHYGTLADSASQPALACPRDPPTA